LHTVYKSLVLWPPRQLKGIRDRSEMAMKRANRSLVWRHMEKLSGSKAQCKLCSKQMMCVGGSTSSTSGLRHHLTSTHPDVMSSANCLPSHPSHRSASVRSRVTTRGHGGRAMQSTIGPLLPWPASTRLCLRRQHSQSASSPASSPLLAD